MPGEQRILQPGLQHLLRRALPAARANQAPALLHAPLWAQQAAPQPAAGNFQFGLRQMAVFQPHPLVMRQPLGAINQFGLGRMPVAAFQHQPMRQIHTGRADGNIPAEAAVDPAPVSVDIPPNVASSQAQHFVPGETPQRVTANSLVYCRAFVLRQKDGDGKIHHIVIHYEGRHEVELRGQIKAFQKANGLVGDPTLAVLHEGRENEVPGGDHPNSGRNMDDLTQQFLNTLGISSDSYNAASKKGAMQSEAYRNAAQPKATLMDRIGDWIHRAMSQRDAHFMLGNEGVSGFHVPQGSEVDPNRQLQFHQTQIGAPPSLSSETDKRDA